jgi:hypothetical protein
MERNGRLGPGPSLPPVPCRVESRAEAGALFFFAPGPRTELDALDAASLTLAVAPCLGKVLLLL